MALVELVDEQQLRFASDETGAKELLSVGESSYDETLSVSELAAYTVAANVFLNLDEVLTR